MKIRANRTPLCEVPKGRPLAQRHRALVPIVNITGSLTECSPMALWPCTQVPFPLALYPNPAFESSSAAVPGCPTCPSCQPTTLGVDVDMDSELRRQYDDEVPVVFIDGRKAFKYRMDEREFLRRLASERQFRSEERRVGKACRSRRSAEH